MPDPIHDEDPAPPADPFEAELVAYLDGELEPGAARRVEARLASDPKARTRAASLKKTFDLLDYLPRPEPSATFTTRTLDKLPAVQASAVPPATNGSSAAAVLAPPKPQRSSPVVPVLSRSAPMAAKSGPRQPVLLSLDDPPTYRWAWAAGTAFAAVAFVAIGYLVASAFRPHQTSVREMPEDSAPPDRQIIENLTLYYAVDNLEFARELGRPEFFGNDPAVSFDPTLKVPIIPREPPSPAVYADHERAFRALSAERRQAIRDLDRQLYADRDRDRLLRVLETYAVWLTALSEVDRQGIFFSEPDLRLAKIQEVLQKQWLERLPPSQRSQLEVATDRDRRIKEMRAEEARRRDEWVSARKNKAQLDLSRTPWPFDSESQRAAVIAFAKAAFRLDDKADSPAKGTRLTANDLERYQKAYSFATTNGGEGWYIYGKTVYDLLRATDPSSGKPVEDLLLPLPADSKQLYVRFDELPSQYQHSRVIPGLRTRIPAGAIGKWPEFPLDVQRDVTLHHKTQPLKSDMPKSFPPLGPCRPGDFKSDVQTFITHGLIPKLTGAERYVLEKQMEGKWPDYPRELVKLSRLHDLSLPGAMLPGSPKQWEALYGPGRAK